MNERERHIAHARLLRREGKTYDEIRVGLGFWVSDKTLQVWLRGIPRPAVTLRGKAKDDLRRECRRLRAQGLTYSEIVETTGASKGSISPWVRDIQMPRAGRQRHEERNATARRRAGGTNSRRAADRRQQLRFAAASNLGEVTHRDLFTAGLGLYWAEGSKDKPWRRNGRVAFINSDPSVLKLFLSWLDLVGVAEDDRRFRLTIHENADVRASEQWWAETLRVPVTLFSRATLKRHNPKTIRHNSGADYHGCLVVSIARSGWLYYAIEGWWHAFVGGVEEAADGAHWKGNWSPVG